MPRKADKLRQMTRGNITMSMNKLNLFNIYRKDPLQYHGKTLYQQKWAAKNETRNYHGEHIREKRFKNVLFDKNLKTYSQLDASLKGGDVAPTPITLQTFATLEKRLEIALFRSMFASSVRQARQFIRGGYVKVNGVVMKHPSFPLKSGDLFSVDPLKVLYALGAGKPSLERSISATNKQIKVWNNYVYRAKTFPEKVLEDRKKNDQETLDPLRNEKAKQDHRAKVRKAQKMMKHEQENATRETILARILKSGNTADANLSAKTFSEFGDEAACKKCLVVYQALVTMKHPLIKNPTDENIAKFFVKDDKQSAKEKTQTRLIAAALRELQRSEWTRLRTKFENIDGIFNTDFFKENIALELRMIKKLNKEKVLENEADTYIGLPYQHHLLGRQDVSKPYFTPWKARPFLGAFAILPSHIEISFDTCHAIYLRDPIARPGHSEVISPFPDHVHERAYMYYVRKGKA